MASGASSAKEHQTTKTSHGESRVPRVFLRYEIPVRIGCENRLFSAASLASDVICLRLGLYRDSVSASRSSVVLSVIRVWVFERNGAPTDRCVHL